MVDVGTFCELAVTGMFFQQSHCSFPATPKLFFGFFFWISCLFEKCDSPSALTTV